MNISISRHKVVHTFNCVVALFAVINLILVYLKFELKVSRLYGQFDLWDLDNEISIPTWFSSMQLLVASVLLWVIAHVTRQTGDPMTKKWRAMAAVFFLMSMDEVSNFHDRSAMLLKSTAHAMPFPTFAWVPFGIALVLAFTVYFFRFAWTLPTKIRFQCWLAAAIFVGGALVVEIITGYLVKREMFSQYILHNLPILEESMEMGGITLFVNALMLHLQTISPAVTFAQPAEIADERLALAGAMAGPTIPAMAMRDSQP